MPESSEGLFTDGLVTAETLRSRVADLTSSSTDLSVNDVLQTVADIVYLIEARIDVLENLEHQSFLIID